MFADLRVALPRLSRWEMDVHLRDPGRSKGQPISDGRAMGTRQLSTEIQRKEIYRRTDRCQVVTGYRTGLPSAAEGKRAMYLNRNL